MKLRCLSFNCSGLPVLTPYRRERVAAFAALAAELDPDLLAVQELFLETDADLLKERLPRHHLHYGRRRPGLVAGGLALLSRWPLRARFAAFEEQGSAWRFSGINRLNPKGVLLASAEVPGLTVATTHLLANYPQRYDGGSYARWQARQLGELEALFSAEPGGAPHLLLGDLNAPPAFAPLAGFLSRLGFSDALNGDSASTLQEKGFKPPLVPRAKARLDYILSGAEGPLRRRSAGFVLDSPVEIKPGYWTTLSDHRGLWAEFEMC